MNTTRKKLCYLMLALSTFGTLYSCKKTELEPMPATAALSVYNAVPDEASLDIYLSGQKVNKTGLPFGNRLQYVEALLGRRMVKITTADVGRTLIDKSIQLTESAFYSLFLINKAQTADLVLIKDAFLNKNPEKAQLRFVNLSPDNQIYNLEIAGDTTSFVNQPFKSATAFKYVAQTSKTTLLLKNKSTGQTVASLNDIELKNGMIYTAWAKGEMDASVEAQKISLKLAVH